MDTVVLPCSCAHEYQDKKYGTGRRVMNQTRPKSQEKVYRCTICGAERGRGK